MPAVTVESVLGLPRIPRPASLRPRPVVQLAEATPTTEGAGFKVWRSFPGGGVLGGDTQWMTAGSGILHDEQLIVFGEGDHLAIRAADRIEAKSATGPRRQPGRRQERRPGLVVHP